MIYFWLSNKSIGNKDEYNLIINWKSEDVSYQMILEEVMKISTSLKLIRLNKGSINNSVVLLIVPEESSGIDDISNKLAAIDNSIDISFFESKTNW